MGYEQVMFVVVFLFVASSVDGLQPPSISDPMFMVNAVDYSNQDPKLTDIPSGMDPMATLIDLRNNIIGPGIGNNTFSNFTELLALRLGNNRLEYLDIYAFESTKIVILILNYNTIGKFPDVCILNETLRTIEMIDNGLTSIPNSKLVCLQNLLSLDLHKNNIVQFPDLNVLPSAIQFDSLRIGGSNLSINGPLPLSNLSELRRLYLNYLYLPDVPDLSLLPVPTSLKLLSLIDNTFTNISDSALAALGNLRLSSLIYPRLDDVFILIAPILVAPYSLRIEQSTACEMVFPYINGVSAVTVSYSELEYVMPDLSALNETLVQLTLSYNPKLNPTPEEILKKLSPLNRLRIVTVRSNNFTRLPDLKPILPDLARVVGTFNPWHCDCNLTWLIEEGQNASLGIEVRDFDGPDMVCASPPHLAGRLLNSLSDEEIECASVSTSEATTDGLETSTKIMTDLSSVSTSEPTTDVFEISTIGSLSVSTSEATTDALETSTKIMTDLSSVSTSEPTTDVFEISTIGSLSDDPNITHTAYEPAPHEGCFSFVRQVTAEAGGILRGMYYDLVLMECAKQAVLDKGRSFYYNIENGTCIIHKTAKPAWNLLNTDFESYNGWAFYSP